MVYGTNYDTNEDHHISLLAKSAKICRETIFYVSKNLMCERG